MSTFLDTLLGGGSLDESLSQGAKDIKILGAMSRGRIFRVTSENGFTITELYPNSKPLPTLLEKKTQYRKSSTLPK